MKTIFVKVKSGKIYAGIQRDGDSLESVWFFQFRAAECRIFGNIRHFKAEAVKIVDKPEGWDAFVAKDVAFRVAKGYTGSRWAI